MNDRQPVKRAVIVSGGSQDGLKESIGPLGGQDFLIGVDRGTIMLLDEGFQPQLALGDFDSVSAEELAYIRQKVAHVEVLPAEKDLTDTEAALQFVAKEVEAEEIVLLGMFGGRVDHMLSNIWIGFQPEMRPLLPRLVLRDNTNTLRFYTPGDYRLERESDKRYLSFIGMTPLKALTLEEVKYPLQAKDYAYPIALVSNEFVCEEMRFSFAEGLLVAIQSRDKA